MTDGTAGAAVFVFVGVRNSHTEELSLCEWRNWAEETTGTGMEALEMRMHLEGQMCSNEERRV